MADDLNLDRIRRDAKDVATRRVVTDHILPTLSRLIVEDVPAMADELERLRAGEDPTPADEGTERTPGQFLHHLHQMTGGERIARLAELKYAADVGWRCILHRHEDLRRERAKAERDALQAAVERLKDLAARMRSHPATRSWADAIETALDHPTEETPDAG